MARRYKVMQQQQFHDYIFEKPHNFSRYSNRWFHRNIHDRAHRNKFDVFVETAGFTEPSARYNSSKFPIGTLLDFGKTRGDTYMTTSANIKRNKIVHVWTTEGLSNLLIGSGKVFFMMNRPKAGSKYNGVKLYRFSHLTPKKTGVEPFESFVKIPRDAGKIWKGTWIPYHMLRGIKRFYLAYNNISRKG